MGLNNKFSEMEGFKRYRAELITFISLITSKKKIIDYPTDTLKIV